MQMKNFMEDLVWQQIDDVIARYSPMCRCERCRHDIVALALNSLPPRYAVTDQGETYTRIENLGYQFNVDIIAAISRAVEIVSNNPRHEVG